jgi:hypothetical protein
MLRRVLLRLTPDLFPDIDPRRPPQGLEDWINHYAHGDEGAQRLSHLLRALGSQGYEQARRKRLHEHFATSSPGISADQLDKFLYRRRLSAEGRTLIVRYLWEQGVLPDGQETPAQGSTDDLLLQVHRSLAGFWDIRESAVADSEIRLAGRYWIYRASMQDPGRYVKGLLTVLPRAQGAGALRVTEQYRLPGNIAEGEHELQKDFTGLMLEKSYRPIMISCLRPDREVICVRLTSIAEAREHANGKVTSMRGIATSSYRCGRFVASPVCFERIPDGYARAPEEELRTLSESQLPPAVLSRLSSLAMRNGLTEL